jgi:hypothetical protein
MDRCESMAIDGSLMMEEEKSARIYACAKYKKERVSKQSKADSIKETSRLGVSAVDLVGGGWLD